MEIPCRGDRGWWHSGRGEWVVGDRLLSVVGLNARGEYGSEASKGA